jgi:hypothetical protein
MSIPQKGIEGSNPSVSAIISRKALKLLEEIRPQWRFPHRIPHPRGCEAAGQAFS